MQHNVFRVGAIDDAIGQEELNAFLRSRKVLRVRSEFVADGRNSFWAFDVEWQDGATAAASAPFRFGSKEKIDYRNVLDEAQFERFRRMREARKKIAEEDAIPAYAVFIDEQLAELAKVEDPLSISSLRKIPGIGEKKVEQFGSRFLSLYATARSESAPSPTPGRNPPRKGHAPPAPVGRADAVPNAPAGLFFGCAAARPDLADFANVE